MATLLKELSVTYELPAVLTVYTGQSVSQIFYSVDRIVCPIDLWCRLDSLYHSPSTVWTGQSVPSMLYSTIDTVRCRLQNLMSGVDRTIPQQSSAWPLQTGQSSVRSVHSTLDNLYNRQCLVQTGQSIVSVQSGLSIPQSECRLDSQSVPQ